MGGLTDCLPDLTGDLPPACLAWLTDYYYYYYCLPACLSACLPACVLALTVCLLDNLTD